MAGVIAFLAMWMAPAHPLDAAAIRKVVLRSMPAMRRCGDAVTGPLAFTIGPTGAVIAAKGGTPCLRHVLSGMRFPAPGTTIDVSYPLAVDPV